MADIAKIPDRGSHLCTVSVYRRADGSIGADLVEMNPRLIETMPGDGPDGRHLVIAQWVEQAALDLLAQAGQLEALSTE